MRVARPAAGLLLAAGLALSGCTAVVAGTATGPGGGPRTDATDADVPVHLAESGDETDRIARNAVADVLTWWEQTSPQLYGADFDGVDGGVWSIDPDETDPADLPGGDCFSDDLADLAENAYYCGDDDAVVYDRAWLADLARDYGPFMVAETMAHEIAHAVQAQAGLDAPSIVAETQAECFAGAWTRWVVDGNAAHVAVRPDELDPYLLSYVYFGDPPGSPPDAEDAHGSLFDQLSAFQEGYADGARVCTAFDESRLYTQQESDPARDAGDRTHGEVVAASDDVLDAFWEQATGTGFPGTEALGGRLAEPDVRATDGGTCAGRDEDADLLYCPADGSVRYDSAGLLAPAHDDVGDFAVPALLALPYALAVRDQRGLTVDGPAAVSAAACATGWLTRETFLGEVDGARQLAPGDVDEAALALLRYAGDPAVVASAGLSDFELLDAFRRGFVDGGDRCGF
ncbi:neutral zinc metallopeptidase [Geodermatophilus sp. SYSU D00700]